MHQTCVACGLGCAGEDAALVRCTGCGLGTTLAVTASVDAQDHVPRSTAEAQRRRRYFERFCDRHLPSLPCRWALDVGCGGGQLLDVLEKRGWRARGLDAFAGAPRDARIIRAQLVNFETTQRFALITMLHSLEHLAEPGAALAHLRNLLEPGGSLVIAVPNFGGAWARLAGSAWSWLNLTEHCYHYTVASLQHLLRTHGFMPVRVATDSSEAPALASAALDRGGFYSSPLGRRRIFRAAAFHAARLSRRPVNWWIDHRGKGAELVVIARLAARN